MDLEEGSPGDFDFDEGNAGDFDFDDGILGDFDLESDEDFPEEPAVAEYNGLTGSLFILLVGPVWEVASTFDSLIAG